MPTHSARAGASVGSSAPGVGRRGSAAASRATASSRTFSAGSASRRTSGTSSGPASAACSASGDAPGQPSSAACSRSTCGTEFSVGLVGWKGVQAVSSSTSTRQQPHRCHAPSQGCCTRQRTERRRVNRSGSLRPLMSRCREAWMGEPIEGSRVRRRSSALLPVNSPPALAARGGGGIAAPAHQQGGVIARWLLSALLSLLALPQLRDERGARLCRPGVLVYDAHAARNARQACQTRQWCPVRASRGARGLQRSPQLAHISAPVCRHPRRGWGT